MALSQEDVRGIADYARIALEGDELEAMTAYMNDAVAMLAPVVGFAQEADPTYHPIGDLANVMRPDDVKAGLELEDALYNAVAVKGRCFRVPSIMPGEAEGGDQ